MNAIPLCLLLNKPHLPSRAQHRIDFMLRQIDGIILTIIIDPSGRTVALRSTQPLTEMSTRNIFWGVKAADAQGCQPYHLHVPIVLKSGSLKLLEPSGCVKPCNGIALPLLLLWNWFRVLFVSPILKVLRKKIGKVVSVHTMKAHRGSRSITPLILNLGTRRRWLFNITLRPFNPQKRTPVPVQYESGYAPEPV